MKSMLSTCLVIGISINMLCEGRATDPAPKKTPTIKCEMRWTGKGEVSLNDKRYSFDAPDAADVTITNISDEDVDIGSDFGPRLHLDLRVKDPAGVQVKTEPYSSNLTIRSLAKSIPHILKPGEAYKIRVDLLSTVPEEKRIAGTYKVVAVYTIGETEYKSAEVEIKWPWKAK
ncbi:hypothetical protein [Zavarzinella formosa]|uniref:hypothetical protein n=1 Tax=Zavarzinella formosa TaxID=360055 RepID=UPI00031A5F2D|nr:hypothetical protein [Zavarzinella formosa]